MSNDSTNDDLIERYLGGEMSGIEREQFEARLSSDEPLGRSLKIEQAITRAIAIDRGATPVRQAEMRSRAIDAIARIAPSAPALAPVIIPEIVERDAGRRRPLGPIYSGIGLIALLAVGCWLLLRPADVSPGPLPPAARTVAPASDVAPAPDVAPATSWVVEDTVRGARTPGTIESTVKNSAAAKSKRPAARGDQPARSAESAVRTRVGSKTVEAASDTRKGARKSPPVFGQPRAESEVIVDPNPMK